MSYTVTAKCPGCRAGYLVSCRTEGVAEAKNADAHCFTCERCGSELRAPLPVNGRPETVSVRRDPQSIG